MSSPTRFAETATTRGGRPEQHDAALVAAHVIAIADGLGGRQHAARASADALEALELAVTGRCDEAGLRGAVEIANGAVKRLAVDARDNPGTTLVALVVDPDGSSVLGAWCGDSRAWLLDGDELSLLTRDHTDEQGLAACLGDHGDDFADTVDTFTVPVGHGHRVVLTTDGVHGAWTRPGTAAAAGARIAGGEDLATLVADAAVATDDNATAIVVDVDRFAAGPEGAAPRVRRRSRRKPWRYGTITRGDQRLVVLPERELRFQVEFARILLAAETFGDYERRCRAAGRRFVTAGLFFVDDVDEDFLDPDAPFAIYEIPGAADGDFPPYLETVMLDLLPDELAERLALVGELHEPWFNAPSLVIDPADLERVAECFAAHGIAIVEDEASFRVLQSLIEVL